MIPPGVNHIVDHETVVTFNVPSAVGAQFGDHSLQAVEPTGHGGSLAGTNLAAQSGDLSGEVFELAGFRGGIVEQAVGEAGELTDLCSDGGGVSRGWRGSGHPNGLI